MDTLSLGPFGEAARGVAAIACFRALPIAGFLLATRQIGWKAKLAIAATLACASIALRAWTPEAFAALLAAYLYFAVAASAAPAATRMLRERRLTRGGLFVGSAASFLGLPCLLLPGSVRGIALLVGWDFMLSSYSYCVDVAHTKESPSYADGLFFILVNPCLVYARRGRTIRAPGPDARGAVRGLVGLGTLFGASWLLTPACSVLAQRAAENPTPGAALPLWALFGLFRFLLEYGRQSGLASLQIGLMRQLGHEIPERYRWPLFAADPPDFWRRWNTYVGGWVLRYVFWPIAVRYRGLDPTWRLRAAQGLALVSAFVAVGVLHDAYAYAVAFDDDLQSLRAFAVMGLIVTGWEAASRIARAIRSRAPGRTFPAAASNLMSRLGFWVVAIAWAAWGWQ